STCSSTGSPSGCRCSCSASACWPPAYFCAAPKKRNRQPRISCEAEREMAAKIVIVDYGMANLRSVQKAFEQVGHAAEITSDPDRVAAAAKVVLPGVGAFRDAIAKLRETHLATTITEQIKRGKPFLGICLGLQMLFTRGYEDGTHNGLDLFPGEVVRFPAV